MLSFSLVAEALTGLIYYRPAGENSNFQNTLPVYPKVGVPQGSNLSPLLFLIYVNDMPNPSHHQTDKSQFADDTGQWAVSKNIDLAVEYLQRDLDKLARWCAKWRIKLNPEKTNIIIFSKVSICNKGRTCFIFIRRPPFILYSNKILRYHI